MVLAVALETLGFPGLYVCPESPDSVERALSLSSVSASEISIEDEPSVEWECGGDAGEAVRDEVDPEYLLAVALLTAACSFLLGVVFLLLALELLMLSAEEEEDGAPERYWARLVKLLRLSCCCCCCETDDDVIGGTGTLMGDTFGGDGDGDM